MLSNEYFRAFAMNVLYGVKARAGVTKNIVTIVGEGEMEFPFMYQMMFFVKNGEKLMPRVVITHESVDFADVRIISYRPDGEVAERFRSGEAGEAGRAVDFILRVARAKKTA